MQNHTLTGTIHPAQPEDAPWLTALAFASKAYWGYDAAFMAACRAELTVTPERIAAQPTYVLEENTGVIGFYMLDRNRAPLVELDFLFVAPHAIGRGYGRILFAHAVTIAVGYGDETLLIQSDPHAEGFYRACGAQIRNYTPSARIAGRMLPTLTLVLQAYRSTRFENQSTH